VNHVGYGVRVDGKPRGIWPVTLAFARQTAAKLSEDLRYHNKKVEVVSVHVGDTVPLTEPAPIGDQTPRTA
jgi:hypothetical protein